MKFILLFIIFCIISSKTFSETPSKSSANWKLVWPDESSYHGLPDPAKWSCDVVGKGWGNNELHIIGTQKTKGLKINNPYTSFSCLCY